MIRKQNLALIAAPLLTAAILAWVYQYYALYPFGDNSLAWCDMTQQAIPLMMQAGDLIKDGFSLDYNLKSAGGMNFWGVLLFFEFSPFTLLAPLIAKADFLLWANILVLLKSCVASGTASIWFGKVLNNKGIVVNVALSTAYALCGYTMMYYQNNIWMDILYLFPLFMLAFFYLLEKQKFLPYTLALSAMIMINYYISYTVILFVLFAVLAFCVLNTDKEIKYKTVVALGLGTLIALGLTCVIWLPSVFQYLVSARTADQGVGANNLYTNLYTTLSFILCTTTAIAGFLTAGVSKKSSLWVQMGMILFVLLSIPLVIDPINKIWHTGSYQAFPVRYGFILVFLGLSLGAQGIKCAMAQNNVAFKLQMVFAPLVLVSGLFFLCAFMLENKLDKLNSYVKGLWTNQTSYRLILIVGTLFICAHILLFFLFRGKKVSYAVFAFTLAALVAVESGFSGSIYMGAAAKPQGYFGFITDLGGKVTEQEFYRVKTQTKIFDVNLLGAIGYNNLAHYTSLTRKDYMFAAKKLGYSSYWMEVGSHGGSVISDAILKNDYIISRNDQYALSSAEVYNNKGYWIHESDYKLPFGVVVSGDMHNNLSLGDAQRMEMSETLLQKVTGSEANIVKNYTSVRFENVLYSISGNNHSITVIDKELPAKIIYSIPVRGETALYFDCFHDFSNSLKERINDSTTVTVNGAKMLSSYPTQSNNGLQLLGVFANETVEVTVDFRKSLTAHSFGVWGVDMKGLSKMLDSIPPEKTNMNAVNNKITGTAFAEEETSFLFLPIPYDEGFGAQVNGKDVEIVRVFDSFIGVPLTKGENQINIVFHAVGIRVGAAVSVLFLMICVLIAYFKEKHFMRAFCTVKKGIYLVFLITAGGALFVVYVYPMAMYLFRAVTKT